MNKKEAAASRKLLMKIYQKFNLKQPNSEFEKKSP